MVDALSFSDDALAILEGARRYHDVHTYGTLIMPVLLEIIQVV